MKAARMASVIGEGHQMETPDFTATAESSTPTPRSFSAKSTATQAQYERLLPLLRLRPHHTMELRRAGIMMPAARIKELNDRYGYSIERVERISLWDEWGFCHAGVAVYSLVSEPTSAGAA